jgi:hypothetical protein
VLCFFAAGTDDRQFCRDMGIALNVEEDLYQVGLTKVFFKKGTAVWVRFKCVG